MEIEKVNVAAVQHKHNIMETIMDCNDFEELVFLSEGNAFDFLMFNLSYILKEPFKLYLK